MRGNHDAGVQTEALLLCCLGVVPVSTRHGEHCLHLGVRDQVVGSSDDRETRVRGREGLEGLVRG